MNWNALRILVVCLILIVLHYTLRPLLGWSRVEIDFMVIATVFGAVRMRPGLAALYGLFLGLVSDSLALGTFGAAALGLSLVAFAASRLKAVFFADDLRLNALFLFLGEWAFRIIFLLAGHRTAGAELVMNLLVWSPLSAAVTAAAGVLVLSLLRPLMEVRTA